MPTSPEAYLISAVLRTGDFKSAMANGINSDMFAAFRQEWTWLETYFRRHRTTPSIEAFKHAFPDFRVMRTMDLGYFVDEVRKHHTKMSLIAMMTDLTDLITDGDIETAVKKVNSSIVHIAASMGTDVDTDIFSDYRSILADVEARVHRFQEKGSSGIPTGIPSLDEETGGLNPGDLIIIGARLGHGKSWVMQRMAAAASSASYKVVFDALEQSRAQVAMRVHTLLSSTGETVFRNTALMQGKDFDLAAYRVFLKKLRKQMKGGLHVMDNSRGKVSVTTVQAQIERHQPDIVFIDYITLMAKSGPDWQGVAQLSSELKALATAYQIPIVAAAQLNRAEGLGKGEPAGPEALAQSDAIGQDADMVITMRQMSPSVIQMKMAKNRNGPGGFRWWMHFDPGAGVIQEVSYNKAQDIMDADRDVSDQE